MSDTAVLGLAGVILAALIAGFFGLRAAMVTARVNKEGNAVNFSQNLMARLEKLETKVEEQAREIKGLSRVFTVSLNFIEEFLLWARDGSKPPIPTIPESLKEHLDPELISEHRRQHQESMNSGPIPKQ